MQNFLTKRRRSNHGTGEQSTGIGDPLPQSGIGRRRFKKLGIKYVDYKDGEFLKKFLNEQGKILPRRLTGTSQKFQKKVAQAVKRARHLAILPFVTDCMK